MTKLDDASNPNTAAVIGSQRLSEIYGLSILEENIQDLENNQTRFLIVASEGVPASKNDRTSIVCSAHKNQPGSLHRLLGVFEKAGLNLTQVLSRPSKLELGEYIFFLEFLGHQDDPPVHAVLQEIKDMCLYYKYLGSYPVFSD